ncbi:unnamed protein product, partial [Ectocarpus sp. 8 AP-2014]
VPTSKILDAWLLRESQCSSGEEAASTTELYQGSSSEEHILQKAEPLLSRGLIGAPIVVPPA